MTTNHKIAHVVPAINIGGVFRQLQQIQQLKERGIKSSIISIFDLNEPLALAALDCEIETLRIDPKHYRGNYIPQYVTDALLRLKADVIHSHHLITDYYAAIAARQIDRPAVRSIHGISQASWANISSRSSVRIGWNEWDLEKEREIESYFSHTVAVSADLKEKLINWGFAEKKISVICPGVESLPEEEQVRGLQRELETYTIAFLNRLEPVKNPLFLLNLALLLREQGLQYQFIYPATGSLLRQLRSEIIHRSLQDWFYEVEAVPEIWASIPRVDSCLLSSFTEGLPMVILEAMARGVPVVASRVGGIPEAIKDRRTGLLFDIGDHSLAASHLSGLHLEPEFGKELVTNARDAIQKQFSLASFLEAWARIYRKIARLPGNGGIITRRNHGNLQ